MITFKTLNELTTKEFTENTGEWTKEPLKEGMYYVLNYKPVLVQDIKTEMELKIPIVKALDIIRTFYMYPKNTIQLEYVQYLISQGNNIKIIQDELG